MSNPYLGEIRIVGFNFAPVGWALCDGAVMSISQNTALFSLLGTTYGGDGLSTFALPNLLSRVPINAGQGTGLSFYSQGQVGGAESVILTEAQMAAHSHVFNASTSPALDNNPTNNYPAEGRGPTYGPTTNAVMNPAVVSPAGNGQPHSNVQPYLAVLFIIALSGIFPTRN